MDDKEFRQHIERLQIEIQNTQTLNEKDQELLIQLDSEIHEILSNKQVSAAHIHPNTIERLEDGLGRFETTHPTLTNLISELLEVLSNAGI
jgi:hypothetical protein